MSLPGVNLSVESSSLSAIKATGRIRLVPKGSLSQMQTSDISSFPVSSSLIKQVPIPQDAAGGSNVPTRVRPMSRTQQRKAERKSVRDANWRKRNQRITAVTKNLRIALERKKTSTECDPVEFDSPQKTVGFDDINELFEKATKTQKRRERRKKAEKCEKQTENGDELKKQFYDHNSTIFDSSVFFKDQPEHQDFDIFSIISTCTTVSQDFLILDCLHEERSINEKIAFRMAYNSFFVIPRNRWIPLPVMQFVNFSFVNKTEWGEMFFNQFSLIDRLENESWFARKVENSRSQLTPINCDRLYNMLDPKSNCKTNSVWKFVFLKSARIGSTNRSHHRKPFIYIDDFMTENRLDIISKKRSIWNTYCT